jgi:hypothetical protein
MGGFRAAVGAWSIALVSSLLAASLAGAEQAKPVSESTGTLPGAIEPLPVNVKLEEEFWARVREWEGRGKLATAVPESEVRLAPGLEGGWVGWCMTIRVGTAASGRCPVAPRTTEPVGYESWEAGGGGTRGVALVSSIYEGVTVDDAGTAEAAVPVDGVPGVSAAIVALPMPFPATSGWFDEFEPVSHGIRSSGSRGWAGPQHDYSAALGAAGWQAPSHPPPGACTLGATRLRGLRARGGHVVTTLAPTINLAGGGFVSCVDVQYAFDGSTLDGALLLSAAEPGGSGALPALPGATAVPHHPGYLSAPGWNGRILAHANGAGWLAVEGGSSLRDRLRVLMHLRARVG